MQIQNSERFFVIGLSCIVDNGLCSGNAAVGIPSLGHLFTHPAELLIARARHAVHRPDFLCAPMTSRFEVRNDRVSWRRDHLHGLQLVGYRDVSPIGMPERFTLFVASGRPPQALSPCVAERETNRCHVRMGPPQLAGLR